MADEMTDQQALEYLVKAVHGAVTEIVDGFNRRAALRWALEYYQSRPEGLGSASAGTVADAANVFYDEVLKGVRA